MKTDVLIVGAGPTGLALATALTRAGVPAVIVDRLATSQNTSRAAVIHAHTLEILDSLDAPQRLLRNLLLRTIGSLPAARCQLDMDLSGISRRAAAGPRFAYVGASAVRPATT